jgi:hypothetical protein
MAENSFNIVHTANTNPFKINLDIPILNNDLKLKIALKTLAFYYTIPNVDKTNNIFSYSYDGTTFIDIELEQGAYEIHTIINRIMNMGQSQDLYNSNNVAEFAFSSYFTIEADPGSMRTRVKILDRNFKIDFSCENSIGDIFGFESMLEYGKEHVSENIIDIHELNMILVHCDLVDGAVNQGSRSQSIYSFVPNVGHGYKIEKEVWDPDYYNIAKTHIHEIKIWLTDQNLSLLNTNEESISICLRMK